MTTKELLKKIEKKNTFVLAWAILWRIWVLTMGFYLVALFFALIIAVLIG